MVRDSIKFRAGKYIGVCPEDVLGLRGDAYLQWIATLDEYSDKDVLNHVRDRIICDTEIQFGKHNGMQLWKIKDQHPRYWKWLKQQAVGNSKLGYLKYA
jgi:uncharacterized protein (DUF3820 family)